MNFLSEGNLRDFDVCFLCLTICKEMEFRRQISVWLHLSQGV